MKVSIIGGGGLVGSCAGFALQAGKIVREINLVDVNQDLCEGQALDLLHGASILSGQKITFSTTAGVKDADVIVITAGLRRKPDESRLDLINRNVTLFRGILADMKSNGIRKDAIVFVVSNPVDVLTYLAIKELGLPASQVIGLGTVLDTTRLRSMLAQRLDVPPTQVQVTIFGEHGDSMVFHLARGAAAGGTGGGGKGEAHAHTDGGGGHRGRRQREGHVLHQVSGAIRDAHIVGDLLAGVGKHAVVIEIHPHVEVGHRSGVVGDGHRHCHRLSGCH